MHFGNVTTNRVKTTHSNLKRHLCTSTGSFDTTWISIHAMLERQHIEITSSFEKSLNIVQHQFNPVMFKELRGFISRNALNIILPEAMRSESIGPDAELCRCVIRRTHGLPCVHEIAQFKQEGWPIPLSSIHSHWRKLNIKPTLDGRAAGSIDVELFRAELHEIMLQFEHADAAGKAILMRKVREISNPEVTSLIEPKEKAAVKGASKKKKKRKS